MDTEALKQRIKTLEKVLIQANEKISFSNAIIESSNLIVWSVDLDFNLISYNQNFFIQLLPANEDKKMYYDENGEVKSEATKKFWDKNYKQVLKGHSVNFEIRIENEGRYEWKQIFLNPVYANDVKIIAISGVAYDVTEKTESRRRLVNSEEKFRNIFESFQDLYFRTDFRGNIIMLSPSVKDILGYTEKQLLGKNATNYYIYNIKIKSLLRQLVSEGSVRNFDTGIIHKSGRVIPCICNVRVISHNGKPQYLEGVARDITELRQAAIELQESKEIAEKSLRIKERFLANMSHEIRTPLNGIMGMLHLVEDSTLNPTNKNRLNILKNSAQILMGVLNDLLDLSKIEAGKMHLSEVSMNTRKLFNDLASLYEAEATKKNIKLSFTIDAKVPQNIIADEIKLIQIFSNLISNALKFTPSNGSIDVNLSAYKLDKKDKLVLKGSVKDDGIGISKKHQKKIFNSFSQLDSSSSKAYKGTGLGLFISKKLASLMKGTIDVESEENQGSNFWFTFETQKTALNPVGANPTKKVELENSPNIMVVDDNQVNIQVASEILINAGCKVTKIRSGKAAILEASKYLYDLILMDIQMPDIDGIDASKAIKAKGLNKKTPIIAMTAYSMKGDKEKFLTFGLDAYISKPIKPDILLNVVKQWTGNVESKSQDSIKAANKAATLNREVIQSLYKYGGKETIEESIDEFNNETIRQIEECHELVRSKSFEEILIILHTLKGNSGTLGADKMAEWAEYMEGQVKKKNYHIFENNLNQLQELHSRFILAFKEFKLD